MPMLCSLSCIVGQYDYFLTHLKVAVLGCLFQRKSHLAQLGVPEQFCVHGFLACWPHRRKCQNAEL